MPRLMVATTLRFEPDMVEGENRAMVEALADRGLRPELRPWHSELDPWLEADLVVVRTTWDYPAHLDEFDAWLAALDDAGIPVINPVAFLRWNLRKRYLVELGVAGVPIVPVELVAAGTTVAPSNERRVLKPEVGVGGLGATLVEPGESPVAEVDSILNPFLPRVATGERSVFVVDGEPIATFRKVPSGEEFRVHTHHGGTYEVEDDPSPAVLAAARHAYEVANTLAAGGGLVYLRVDLLERDDDEWLVLELEGLEPSLYPEIDDRVTAAVAGAVSSRVPEG